MQCVVYGVNSFHRILSYLTRSTKSCIAVSSYLLIASICLILFGCVKSEVVRKAEWEEHLNDVFFGGP